MTLLFAAGMLILFAVIWLTSWRSQKATPSHLKPIPLFELSNPAHILISDTPPLLGSTFTAITRREFEQRENITWTNSPVTYPNTLRHLGVVPQKDTTPVDAFTDFVICDIHPTVGKGIFATKRIPAGTILGIYTGIVELARGNGGPYALDAKVIDKPRFLYDAARFRNATSYMQHAPETETFPGIATANVDMKNSLYGGIPLMLYITLRDIEPYEQLLVYYGNHYWKKKSPKLFDKQGNLIENT